jgi:hypothetical protein
MGAIQEYKPTDDNTINIEGALNNKSNMLYDAEKK